MNDLILGRLKEIKQLQDIIKLSELDYKAKSGIKLNELDYKAKSGKNFSFSKYT